VKILGRAGGGGLGSLPRWGWVGDAVRACGVAGWVRGRPAQCPGVPLHRQGHPKIISTRSAEMIFRTHP
jgi:hypothetical protein